MYLDNLTKFNATYNFGLDKDGRKLVVILVKASYRYSDCEKSELALLEKQLPFFEADEYLSDPESSPTIFENDFAPFKKKCDVILKCSAYAPVPQGVTEMLVGLKLNDIDKSIRVLGDRQIIKTFTGYGISDPEKFVTKEVSYKTAFGGTEQQSEDTNYLDKNPYGVGFYPGVKVADLVGRAMPNMEQPDVRITDVAYDGYLPMAFGPLGRSCMPRRNYAGTCDENWAENRAPFLPTDFDEAFYQCAPEDQQTDYLRGGERISLIGLSYSGHVSFDVPKSNIAAKVISNNGEQSILQPKLDTVLIDGDLQQVSFVWRASIPIKRHISELERCVIGKTSKAWERSILTGKKYIAKGANAGPFGGNFISASGNGCCGNCADDNSCDS